MKWLLSLLVLLNIGLAVYFNVDQFVPPVATKNAETNADKLKILDEQALADMPQRTPEPAPAPTEVAQATNLAEQATCYRWGNFSNTNLPAAQVVLVRLGLVAEVKPVAQSNEDRRFWVYYPPLKSADEAKRKADEIRALGVEELFVVQDSQWRNAISFGLFADEQLASSLLSQLQAKGVKGATKALRNPGKGLSNLLIKNVSAATALELQKIKPEFVGTDLEPAACV